MFVQGDLLSGPMFLSGVPIRGVCLQRGLPLWGLPPETDIYWRPLQRPVRILLECILVKVTLSLKSLDVYRTSYLLYTYIVSRNKRLKYTLHFQYLRRYCRYCFLLLNFIWSEYGNVKIVKSTLVL